MRYQGQNRTGARMHWRPAVGAFARPTVLILLAATIAHIMRRNVFDVVIFAGTAALIVADSGIRGRHPGSSAARIFALPWWLVTAAAVVFGGLVGSLTPASWPVRICLGVPGVLALILLLTAPLPAGNQPRARDQHDRRSLLGGQGWLAWPALLIVAALIELSSFLLQPNAHTDSYDHPTLSTLISPLLGSPIARGVALACWLTAGWWLVRTIRNDGRR